MSAATSELRDLNGQTFAGVRMAQSWADLWLWEQVLNDHPELRTVIEIGTWEGGMSQFLIAQTRKRQLCFLTFDVDERAADTPGFLRINVFEEAPRVQGMLEALAPVLLFCDGGDKPRELAEFGPCLQPGSLAIVHDWGNEVGSGDVPSCLTPIYEATCDELGSHSRVFAA